MKIAVGLLFLSDVDALPDVFRGSHITTSWYWNEDKPARAWADRFTQRFGGGHPADVDSSLRLFGRHAMAERGEGGGIGRRRQSRRLP